MQKFLDQFFPQADKMVEGYNGGSVHRGCWGVIL